MKDIIERLLGSSTFPDTSCMPEAAAEITALRAQIEELTQYNAGRTDEMIAMTRQFAAVTQERDNLQKAFADKCFNSYQKLAVSQAREQQLREASVKLRQHLQKFAVVSHTDLYKIIDLALSTPSDTAALNRANKLYAANVLDEIATDLSPLYRELLNTEAEQFRKEAEK